MEHSRQKAQQYRERLKEDPLRLQAYRLKAKQRSRKHRKKLRELSKENEKLMKEKREKDRLRQKKHREIKENEASKENNFGAYSCKQTLGKALKKVEKALPEDLQKKYKLSMRYIRNIPCEKML